MIISSTHDYRLAAKRRLPPFLFHYIDGGAYDEHTLARNVADLRDLALRQRVLKEAGEVDLSARLFGEDVSLPVALAPVGLTGMYARRGEVQAARAAASRGVPFTLSSVSVYVPGMTRISSPSLAASIASWMFEKSALG